MIDSKSLIDKIFHSNKDKIDINNPISLEVSSLDLEKDSIEISKKNINHSDLESSEKSSSKLQDAIIYIKEDE